MKYSILSGITVLSLACWALLNSPGPDTYAASPPSHAPKQSKVQPATQTFIQTYCVSCHNEDKTKAKYRIDDLSAIAEGQDTVRWEKALEMISLGDMPPIDAKKQPTQTERDRVVSWMDTELKKIGRGNLEEAMRHPSEGNRVPHDKLFSGEHKGPAFSPARLWRLNRYAYAAQLSGDGSASALEVLSGSGIKDYASLTADEAAVSVMLESTDAVASLLVGEIEKTTQSHWRRFHRSEVEKRYKSHLIDFYNSENPSKEACAEAVRDGFVAIFDREPKEAEHQRFLALFNKTSAEAGHKVGFKTMLRGMMMSPEFVYRMELGMGEELPDGRRMLSPMELAYAIAYAVVDTGPDKALLKAAEEGRLETKADVEREVRRLLAIEEPFGKWLYGGDPKNMHKFYPQRPRVLRFFREFFGYAKAMDVFKDDTRSPRFFWPVHLVRDADQLVWYALEQDRQVLEFLLTTDKYFVAWSGPQEGLKKPWIFGGWSIKHVFVYNTTVQEWHENYVEVQPFKQEVPRAGILTHPAWLMAHSGNFDNDIIHRGIWIREHLLADLVPDLPIGVDAKLTPDPTLTLREKFKLAVYNKEDCWRCHKKMNPLGNPFEMYDDFGRFRTDHHFDDEGKIVNSPKVLLDPKQEGALHTKPVKTDGILDGTGDPELDGEVENAVDMMHRLAKSDRVRQSFIRHAFRYWMGRNETLDDSPTLMAADKAYVDSDGSFKEMLVSLLTSDSFLYRK